MFSSRLPSSLMDVSVLAEFMVSMEIGGVYIPSSHCEVFMESGSCRDERELSLLWERRPPSTSLRR